MHFFCRYPETGNSLSVLFASAISLLPETSHRSTEYFLTSTKQRNRRNCHTIDTKYYRKMICERMSQKV